MVLTKSGFSLGTDTFQLQSFDPGNIRSTSLKDSLAIRQVPNRISEQQLFGRETRKTHFDPHQSWFFYYPSRMRIRANVSKVLIVALVLTLIPGMAFSAQKISAGGKCKTLNQKVVYSNKTYTCTKSGKKLVWNKGVVRTKPTPKPSPAASPIAIGDPEGAIGGTPSPSPTPTPVFIPITFDDLYGNSQGISIAAWNSANEKIKKSDAVTVRQDIFAGPNTTIPNANVKEIFENATKLFAGFAQPQSFYAFYYRFQDKEWTKAKFSELNLSHLTGQVEGSCASLQRCQGASAGKAFNNVGFSQFAVAEPGDKTDIYHLGGGIEIHEYTHIAQAMQFSGKQKDDRSFQYLPQWFVEGHAHIAGNTGSAKTMEEYLKNRGQWLSTYPNSEIKSFEPVDIERFYAALMPGKYNAEMFGYVYTIGYITLECLVALKGIDSPTELIVQVSNGLTFEEAFAKVYGISWNEASPILAKTVSQIFLAR